MSGLGRRAGELLGLAYRAMARPRHAETVTQVLASARRTIDAKTYCLMITESGGSTTARVVQPHHVDLDDLVVHLGTDPSSRKVADVEDTGRCQLVFQRDSHRCCVVLDCAVEVLRGPEAGRHFLGVWRAFWPQGPDENFVALRCRAERIEVWDGLHRVAPPPFGRRSAHLVRHGDGWAAEPQPASPDAIPTGVSSVDGEAGVASTSESSVPDAVASWHELADLAREQPDDEDRIRAQIDELVAEDVVFYSPVVHSPQEGKEITTAYLQAAMVVLGPTVQYDRELYSADSAVLEFHADLDGTAVHGIDFLRWAPDSRLVEITVMVRPHQALEKLIERMASQLFG